MSDSSSRLFSKLAAQLSAGELRLDEKSIKAHSGDKWFASHPPEAVATPRTESSVCKILAFANRHKIPVTARGAGFGYVGGCVPMRGGIALSLTKMKRIRQIHERDFVAVVQPGVITKQLQDAVEAKGMFYPPDPASRADCSIGGNIATNAGGPRCLKYGVTRDYVLGLRVALADGTLVRLGGRTHKNKTGFDLHRLFVGSEGMLGVVTEATLKLLPLPPFRASLSVGFRTMKKAIESIDLMFGAGFLPCAVELADQFTLAAARKRTGSKMFDGCKAHLIVELDGQERAVRSDLAALRKLIGGRNPVFTKSAYGVEACERIWEIRREFSYSLRDTGLTKLNEDITVPRSRLEDLFNFAATLQKKYGLPVACFGHAGDGNIHVNIMVDETNPQCVKNQDAALDALFQQVVAWDGAITGEHGVGLAKKRWWDIAVSKESQKFHRHIKDSLDPNDILNPGKFV